MPKDRIEFEKDGTCLTCSTEFNVTERRHQCRGCGKSFCHSCSTADFGGGKERVCKKCFEALNSNDCIGCTKRKVIIDTDVGFDDATALLIALTDPAVEVVAITIVFGNMSLDTGVKSAQKVLRLLRATHIPVYEGCATSLVERKKLEGWAGHGSDGLGDGDFTDELKASPTYLPTHQCDLNAHSHASEALIKLSKLYKNDVSLLALGPVTNIALALKLDSSLLTNFTSVTCMGGTLGRGNSSIASEFNVHADPEAYKVLLHYCSSSSVMMTMVTWDVCETHPLSWREYDELVKVQTPKAVFLEKVCTAYAAMCKPKTYDEEKKEEMDEYAPCDAYAYVVWRNPSCVKKEQNIYCVVETGGEHSAGAIYFDWYSRQPHPPNVRLVHTIDRTALYSHLQKAI